MNIIIDNINKTINNQSPKQFFDNYYDGKEDYHTDDEYDFINDVKHIESDDLAYQVIYSNDDLIIEYFQYLINNNAMFS